MILWLLKISGLGLDSILEIGKMGQTLDVAQAYVANLKVLQNARRNFRGNN